MTIPHQPGDTPGAAAPKRIEDYALLADGETAALVHRSGAIEWLCMPRFDSGACFAALVGEAANGGWWLAPDGHVTATERRYVGDTMILETEHVVPGGRVRVTDFMPIREQAPDIVRIVDGLEGRVAMRSVLAPRFDDGRVRPLVRRLDERGLCAVAGPNGIVFRADVAVADEEDGFTSSFAVEAGERVCFTMTWYPSFKELPNRVDPPLALQQTRDYWRGWIGGNSYAGPHEAEVRRSLLTLKALTHTPTGAIVAAPTTSLPERAGGARNWDYRYCWLRDATFTLVAFLHCGLDEEAKAWVAWLRRAIAGEPVTLQPFYTVKGDRHAPEREADWLAGFNDARPVRFGNGASTQFQLDSHGEVLDALFMAREALEHGEGSGDDGDALFRLLARDVEKRWREPDAGIWESRGDPCHHVHSKAMCWVAFDRAARWFEADADLTAHYRALADEVRAEVLARGFDEARGSFVSGYGIPTLDAATLLLPVIGFIDANDPRMLGTVAAIERELVRGPFVLRYLPEQTDDGVGGEEGAFLPCSFWLAQVYALQGRHDEATALLNRLCATANDLGLLSEEADPVDGRLLGNFPQALSHLSLIGTAAVLSGRSRSRQEAGDSLGRAS